MLADALIARAKEGAHSCHCCNCTRLIQTHLAAQFHRLTVRQAGAEHFPTHTVEDDFRALVVAVWPSLPEVGDGRQDDVRVDRLQRIVVQA